MISSVTNGMGGHDKQKHGDDNMPVGYSFTDAELLGIKIFKNGCAQNVGKSSWLCPLGKVHIQVMPDFFRRTVIHTIKQKGLGMSKLWIRFGVVIASGEDVDLEPGLEVMFDHKYGYQFGGRFNPINVSCSYDDELRVIGAADILATVQKEYINREVSVKDFVGDVYRCKVVEESSLYGSLLGFQLTGDEEGAVFFLPKERIIEEV
jgi:hypothetical protein